MNNKRKPYARNIGLIKKYNEPTDNNKFSTGYLDVINIGLLLIRRSHAK